MTNHPLVSRERFARLGDVFVLAIAITIALVYGFHAWALFRYPWDFSPDEGYYLDCARRLVVAPATLYGTSLVPYPCYYTPLLFVLLAPFVEGQSALASARVVAAGWTVLSVALTMALASPRRFLVLASASAALALAPLDLTFWHMLVRMDGLMIALWLVAARILLPREVARGADQLTALRLALGTAAIAGAYLAKQTALLHVAPLVLCWFLVDARSALRLTIAAAASIGTITVSLSVASQGGFIEANRWWGAHGLAWWHLGWNLWNFGARAWPLLVFCAAGGIALWRRGGRPWRDAAVWLCLGGLAAAPAMAKYGALWTYLLPLLPALSVLGARWWAATGARTARVGAALAAVLGGFMVATREFPLPSPIDGLSARAFYSFIRDSATERAGPILAVRPEYAYFVAGQPIEMEGTSFRALSVRNAPGLDLILQRLRRAEYRLVVWNPDFFPKTGPYAEALSAQYRPAGGCVLVFIDGPSHYAFYVPKDSQVTFTPPLGSRCWP